MENEKTMHYKWKPCLLILVILNFLLLIYVAFFKRDSSLRLENLKDGGTANMKLVQQLYQSDSYKQQQTTAIQQALDSMKGGAAQQPTAQQPTAAANTGSEVAQPEANGTTIDAAALATVEKGAYVEGKKNARITILEYSDLVCPFCKRQMDSQVLEQVIAKYPNDVNVIFKNYIVHPQAEKLAEASLCVGEQAGSTAFYSFVQKAFDLTDTSDTAVLALAKSLGAKEAAFTTCLSSGKYASAVSDTTTEGRTLFGVNGTPGNVIVDNQKGTYTLVAGAYPLDTFTAAVDKILGK